jgi:hypothetical protein
VASGASARCPQLEGPADPAHTHTPRPHPLVGTSNQVLEQAKDELQGQAALHQESDKVLTQLHSQSKGDRCVAVGPGARRGSSSPAEGPRPPLQLPATPPEAPPPCPRMTSPPA